MKKLKIASGIAAVILSGFGCNKQRDAMPDIEVQSDSLSLYYESKNEGGRVYFFYNKRKYPATPESLRKNIIPCDIGDTVIFGDKGIEYICESENDWQYYYITKGCNK